MTEQQIVDHVTYASPKDVYDALLAEWRAVLGESPKRASLLVLLAHWSFETGGGGAMHGYNIGNIKHVPGDGHDYVVFQTREFLHGQWVTEPQPFRAYDDLAHGVEDYIHLLRGQFGFAWPAVEAGDVADFSHRLHLRGYYTDPEADYTAGMLERLRELDKVIPPEDPAPVARAGLEQAQNDLNEAPHDEPPPDAA